MKKLEIVTAELDSALALDQANYESELASTRGTHSLFKYIKSLRNENPIPDSITWDQISASSPSEQAELFNS